jgi:hypothetical protein
MSIRNAQTMNMIPGIVPASNTTAAAYIEPVDLDLANWVTFVVVMGAMTSGGGATCDSYTVAVTCSSLATLTSATAIPFTYRLSSALATNSGWGAVTAGTSDGVELSTGAANLTNKLLVIDVDPSVVAAKGSQYRYVSVTLTPATTTAHVFGAISLVETRYPGNTIPSSS